MRTVVISSFSAVALLVALLQPAHAQTRNADPGGQQRSPPKQEKPSGPTASEKTKDQAPFSFKIEGTQGLQIGDEGGAKPTKKKEKKPPTATNQGEGDEGGKKGTRPRPDAGPAAAEVIPPKRS
jgi:hypothetical protein